MKRTTIPPRRANREQGAAICQQEILPPEFAKRRHLQVLSARHLRHRGIAFIWVAITLLLLILLVGFALDTAKVCLVYHQMQNAADAAALAGARVVKIDQAQARQDAINMAFANFADRQPVVLLDNPENDPNGYVVIGRYNRETRIFTPTTQAVNAVAVIPLRTEGSPGGPVPLNFGRIINLDTVNLAGNWQTDRGPYAVAMASGGTGAGLIALAPDGQGLHINGTVSVDVNDGEIQVNSVDDDAVRIIGTPEIYADALNICGTADPTGGWEFEPDFVISTGVSELPDPLWELPEPTWDPADDLAPSPGQIYEITGGTHVLEPGFYSGGFRITGGDVILKPGIYILDGRSTGQKSGLVVGGNANFNAMGVMFFITGDGVVGLAGSGNIKITPIDYDEPEFYDPSWDYPANMPDDYERVSIFQARDNFNDARIVGTSLMDLEGTLYFPRNHLDLSGTSDGFGNQLIAWRIEVSGEGEVTINYDGNFPAPGNRSFLVR